MSLIYFFIFILSATKSSLVLACCDNIVPISGFNQSSVIFNFLKCFLIFLIVYILFFNFKLVYWLVACVSG